MKYMKFLVLVGLGLGLVATMASADVTVSLLPDKDCGMQSRGGGVYGGTVLYTGSTNGAYMVVGNKGVSTTVMGTNGILQDNRDSFARALISFAPTQAAAGDGTLVMTYSANPPGGYTVNLKNVTVELYQISAANAGWTETTTSWLRKDYAGAVDWAGSGAAPYIVSPMPNWGTGGSGGLGAPGGGGYGATPIATKSFGSSDYFPVKGEQWSFTIPQALINDWIANPGQNAGLLIKTDAASEALNGQTGLTELQVQFVTKENAETTYSTLNNNGKPTLTYSIPEPGSLALLALAGAALLRRR